MQQYKLRIEDMAAEERPSNRLMSSGSASLSNAELLSIILKSGSVAENAINLSQRVLSQFDLKQLSAIDAPQLMKIHDIKSGKAVQIVACFELARRLEMFDQFIKVQDQLTRRRLQAPLSGNEGIKEGTFCGAVPGYREPGDQGR